VPPLPPITPITIQDPSGNYVRVQNSSDFAWVGNGTGKTPPETFYAYHSNNTGDTTPIMPGQTTILKSDQTGLYCRIQAHNGTDQGMICDVSDPLQASVFTYNYMGLEYNGTQLLADTMGDPLLMKVPGPGDALVLEPAMMRKQLPHLPRLALTRC
jgi:hypothetical protein